MDATKTQHFKEECPQPGLCLSLSDKVNKLMIQKEERERLESKFWTLLLSILGLSLLHFCGFLIWVGSTSTTLAAIRESDTIQNRQIYELRFK